MESVSRQGGLSLWSRDYLLLWVGQTLSLIGSQTSWVAYPLLVLALTGSAGLAGVVSMASWLPYLLFQLPAGAFVDRWDRKRTLLVCDAGRALAVSSVVVAVAIGHASVAQLVAVAFVERTLTVFFGPAESIALTRIVPSSRLSEAVSRNEAREYTAALLGPPLGGVLYGISRLAPFAADAVSYLVSFMTISVMRTELNAAPTGGVRNLRREIREGLSFVWRQPFLRASLFQAGATNLVWSCLTLAMILVARGHGASSAEIGAMFALMAVGGIAGSIAAPRIVRRASPTLIVVGAVWWWAVLVSALATTTSPYVLGVGAGAALFLIPPWNGTVVGLTMRLTPDAIRGRVQAVDALISYSVRPLGLLATGFLAGSIGGRWVILTLGLLTAVVAVFSTLSPALRNPPQLVEEHA